MEFLYLLLLAVTVFLLWRKPEKEALAWKIFVIASLICSFHFLVNGFSYLMPLGNV